MYKKLLKITYIVYLSVLLSGCTMSKNMPYFKGLETSESTTAVVQHEAVICSDDMLSIIISAIDPVTVAPFNLPVVAYQSPGSENVYATPTFQPYLVDIDGNINFPILGKLKVGGLKKSEAADLIKKELAPYLKDPIVTIQFMNYKITVLGEVSRPGSYTIKNERLSFLEALGMAGDLTIYGRRDNVLLIRQRDNGQKDYIRINLNDKGLLSSPYYYMQQNDVIYVEANKTRVTAAASTNLTVYLSSISTLGSLATVIVTVINANNN